MQGSTEVMRLACAAGLSVDHYFWIHTNPWGEVSSALGLPEQSLELFIVSLASGPHYLYRLRHGVKACLNCGKPAAWQAY